MPAKMMLRLAGWADTKRTWAGEGAMPSEGMGCQVRQPSALDFGPPQPVA
jgi:hypothetical protein